MRKISLPISLLVALTQLEDKDLSKVLRAIITYASKGSVPEFKDGTLAAFFSLFRSAIDEQRSTSEKLSAINRVNAKGKKSAGKKKDAKDSKATSSATTTGEEEVSVALTVDTPEEKTTVVVPHTPSAEDIQVEQSPIPLESIEAIYPKLGSFRNESLDIWSKFTDENRKLAISFVPTYIAMHQNSAEQMYLNQYLKSEIWNIQY